LSHVKLAGLFSGGKDSTYAACIMAQQGHEIGPLVTILPSDPDSWMFHTPNLHLLPRLAAAMNVPLVSVESKSGEEAELEALRSVLEGLEVDGVIVGAIASDYQWDRINGVCHELGLRVFAPLWRKDQSMLMEDMIASGLRAIVVRVSAEGLDASWLRRELDLAALDELRGLSAGKGINVSGEGGEYETLVLDSPLSRYPLEPIGSEARVTRDGGSLLVRDLVAGGG
jgi:ABC transporter with metal-binding/Fe-S-binding domain ATP-binding protein